MVTQSITLNNLVNFLRSEFVVDRYPVDEQGGIYRPSERPVQRLGLALEPGPHLSAWVAKHRPDALWLHRPWQLDPATLAADVGVLYHHLPFDETLTIGYNLPLAAQLGAVGPLEPIGYKQATDETGEPLPRRAIGMLTDVAELEFDAWLHRVKTTFDGYDRAEAGRQTDVTRIAFIGAMNDALVREAADRGANLYVTGQYRKPAQEAVDETGIAVVAVGHRRSEEWGLRALADRLRRHWPELEVIVE